MMQPVYVFVIFCCKRNVYDAIQGTDKKRIISRSRTKGRSVTSSQMKMVRIKGGDHISTVQSSSSDNQTALTNVPTTQA